MESEGIVPFVLGGIGNQIFVVVAGFILSKLHNLPLYIIKNVRNNNLHNTLNINYNETVFRYFGTHLNIEQTENFKLYLISGGYRIHENYTCQEAFDCWDTQTTLKRIILCDKYYQYYPHIKPYEIELRTLIIKGLNEVVKEIINKVDIRPENSAFIHIRRGDYLKNPQIHLIQPISYYEKAYNECLQRNPRIQKFFIFSDDIEWVKNQSFFKKDNFEFYTGNEIESLSLMSQCKAGSICGNSTFSWWGAFLGSYELRNPVIVPKNWISLSCNYTPTSIQNLMPSEWIIID